MKKFIMSVVMTMLLSFMVLHAISNEARASEPDYVTYSDMTSLQDRLNYTAFNLQGKWIHPSQPKPESKKTRRERLRTITKAIILELPNAIGDRGEEWRWSREELAWVTFTKIYHESYWFSLDVHDGRRRGDQGKSVCLGQIMYGSEDLIGTDLKSTRNCIRRVMAFLTMHQHGCLGKSAQPNMGSVARIYAGYGTGRTCDANHWMPKRDTSGNIIRDRYGNPEKFFWAKQRAFRYWIMKTGKHPRQKQKMLRSEFMN